MNHLMTAIITSLNYIVVIIYRYHSDSLVFSFLIAVNFEIPFVRSFRFSRDMKSTSDLRIPLEKIR